MARECPTLPGEIWKPVVGFEGTYEISNFGRVWSVPRASPRSGVLLRQAQTHKGYLRVSLTEPHGLTRSKSVHSLLLTAFVGPRAKKMEAAHLNGNPADNRLDNLAWVTPKENSQHKKLHGTQTCGETHGQAKLTDADVQEIRRLRRQGWYWKDIAPLFGVCKNTARNAGLGLTGFDPKGAVPMATLRWHAERGAQVNCPVALKP